MVLSNKKLKQKLRAAIAENLTSLAATTHSGGGNDESSGPVPDPNSKPQSLKQLLDSASQRPRLSKREKKRRGTLDSLPGSESVNGENGGGNGETDRRVDKESSKVEEENKEDNGIREKKKRKRNDEERKKLDDAGEESGAVKQTKKVEKKKKKKKKKKQKKAKAKVKSEEEHKGSDGLVENEEPNNENDR